MSPIRPTIVGLAIALGVPQLLAAISMRVSSGPFSLGRELLLEFSFCACAAGVVAIVLRFERLSLDSIGLRRPGWSTLATAVLLYVVAFVLQPILFAPLVQAWGQQGAEAGIAKLAEYPDWFRVMLAISAGVVEETLYRGYAVERLATLTGRRWLGATIATLAFGAAHIPMWGVGFALTADLPAGIVLVLFYLWRRDLVANMLAHSGSLIVAMFTIVPRT